MPPPESSRVVVITGANEGIGYHMLTSLLEDGYRVAGLDIDGEHLQSLQQRHPERVRFFECDVTADDDVETAIEAILDEWSQVDNLVDDAAMFDFASFEDQSLVERETCSAGDGVTLRARPSDGGDAV